jgi:hypothetical protein
MIIRFINTHRKICGRLMFMWSCMVKFGKGMNQLYATSMEFLQCSLAQHVSGTNMPISRSTIYNSVLDIICGSSLYCTPDDGHIDSQNMLTLSLLMSYICGVPCKARNFNVVYIWTYVWQRWKPSLSFAAQCFNTESMQKVVLWHSCV